MSENFRGNGFGPVFINTGHPSFTSYLPSQLAKVD
jgi:hypothetical protein